MVQQQPLLNGFYNDKPNANIISHDMPCMCRRKTRKEAFTCTLWIKATETFKAFTHCCNTQRHKRFSIIPARGLQLNLQILSFFKIFSAVITRSSAVGFAYRIGFPES